MGNPDIPKTLSLTIDNFRIPLLPANREGEVLRSRQEFPSGSGEKAAVESGRLAQPRFKGCSYSRDKSPFDNLRWFVKRVKGRLKAERISPGKAKRKRRGGETAQLPFPSSLPNLSQDS